MKKWRKLCSLMSVVLLVGILMPAGALEAVADQGDGSGSAIETTANSSSLVEGASVESTASDDANADSSSSLVTASGTDSATSSSTDNNASDESASSSGTGSSDSASSDSAGSTSSDDTVTYSGSTDSASSGSTDSATDTTSDSSDQAIDASADNTASDDSASAVSSSTSSTSNSTGSDDTTSSTNTFSLQEVVLTAASTITVSDTGSEVDATITGVSIERNGSEVGEVSKGSAFYLVIDWEVTNSSQILNEGDYFDITLPDTLLFPASYTDYEFDITDSDGNVVGTAYVTPGTDNVGGTVRIVFNSNINGKYSVAGSINIQAIANSSGIDEDTTIDITVSTSTSSGSTDLIIDVTTLDDDELLGKWAVRSDNYDGQVYWYVRINYAQANLVNATISDSLTGGDGTEQYVTDSFTLRRVTFANNGNVTTLETIDLTDILTFSDDLRSFTIDLSSMPGAYQYVLTYRTTYTSDTTLSNNVNLDSDSADDSISSSYTWQNASGNADGTLSNVIEIVKVDAEDNTTTLAGAVFTVTAEDGSTFELTTGDDGTVTSDSLTQGTYTVVETTAPAGYELNDTEYTMEVTSSGAAILTVSDTPITTSVSVNKVWVGDAADSVTVHLLANGTDTGEELVLSSDNSWTGTFEDLRAYDSDGNEIAYTVSEDAVDGYSTEITGDAESGFTITNTEETTEITGGSDSDHPNASTETIDVTGTKVWDDSDDADGLRPDSITVNLLQDGTVVDSTVVTADSDGTWSFSFEDLAVYDSDGNEYTYTVAEADVPEGYTSTVSGDVSSGFTITNTLESETTSTTTSSSSGLPLTGDGFWIAPLTLMGILGASAITIALSERRSLKRDDTDRVR
ncbi:MAG: Cna B-type domain-containing protein [Coriobacteriales bacterium]|jgi:uncharacterized surface anchored protein